jgi:hypothetical protein
LVDVVARWSKPLARAARAARVAPNLFWGTLDVQSLAPPDPPARRHVAARRLRHHPAARAIAEAPVAAAALAPSNDPVPVATLVEQVAIPHQGFRLANGLTVIVHEDRKAPVVGVSMWYNVGSKDEPATRPASRICSSI